MKKNRRIKKKREISEVLKNGQRYSCLGYKIIYRVNEEKMTD